MKAPKNPCGRDCPRRAAFCRKDCPEWAKYEAAHIQFLKERQKALQDQNALDSYQVDQSTKFKKKRGRGK